jgi:hypothetical protein
MPFIGAEFQEVPHLGSRITPLFPIAHANSAANPLINLRDWTVILRNTEIIYPTSGILPELHHPVIHGDPPTSAGELTDSTLEFLKRFIGPTNSTTSKGKAKK